MVLQFSGRDVLMALQHLFFDKLSYFTCRLVLKIIDAKYGKLLLILQPSSRPKVKCLGLSMDRMGLISANYDEGDLVSHIFHKNWFTLFVMKKLSRVSSKYSTFAQFIWFWIQDLVCFTQSTLDEYRRSAFTASHWFVICKRKKNYSKIWDNNGSIASSHKILWPPNNFAILHVILNYVEDKSYLIIKQGKLNDYMSIFLYHRLTKLISAEYAFTQIITKIWILSFKWQSDRILVVSSFDLEVLCIQKSYFNASYDSKGWEIYYERIMNELTCRHYDKSFLLSRIDENQESSVLNGLVWDRTKEWLGDKSKCSLHSERFLSWISSIVNLLQWGRSFHLSGCLLEYYIEPEN